MQGYTAPLDDEESQTQKEYIKEQDIVENELPTIRTSARNKKKITRFEDDPETYSSTLKHLTRQK